MITTLNSSISSFARLNELPTMMVVDIDNVDLMERDGVTCIYFEIDNETYDVRIPKKDVVWLEDSELDIIAITTSFKVKDVRRINGRCCDWAEETESNRLYLNVRSFMWEAEASDKGGYRKSVSRVESLW